MSTFHTSGLSIADSAGNVEDVTSILHNITPDHVVFCYRQGDADSLSLAQHYQELRRLPDENLISLPCSSDLTITEIEYESQILNPLVQSLSTIEESMSTDGLGSGSAPERKIWVIILGYNVPNFYTISDETIPVASRVQRLHWDYNGKIRNPVYNKEVFEYLTVDDFRDFYITSVMDGPNATVVRKMMDTAWDIDNQLFINGSIYIDPYGLKATTEQKGYQLNLTNWRDDDARDLGLNIETTVDSDQFDPIFIKYEDDSFVWGWASDYVSSDFFLDHPQKRVFLYNADNISASNIRESSARWCNVALSLSNGYACTAGATENPGMDAHLKPRPFFRALHQGASMGEAFLAASQYIDWKVVLIGDPLLVVGFPGEVPDEPGAGDNDDPAPIDETSYDSDQVLVAVKNHIEEAIAYYLRLKELTEDMSDRVINSDNENENVSLLLPMLRYRDLRADNTVNELFFPVVRKWLELVISSSRKTIDQWLDDTSQMTTQSMAAMIEDSTTSTISDDYISPSGWWSATFAYTHQTNTQEFVNFRLWVYPEDDRENQILEFNSLEDSNGWTYEYRPNQFVQMTDGSPAWDWESSETGFPSYLSGRRVRYSAFSSDKYLDPLELYYIKWQAIDKNGDPLTSIKSVTRPVVIKSVGEGNSGWTGTIDVYRDDDILFYADFFAKAIDAGNYALSATNDTVSYLNGIKSWTMPAYVSRSEKSNIKVKDDPIIARRKLVSTIRNLRGNLGINSNSTNAYVDAAGGLFAFSLNETGKTIDEYLTDNGYQVYQSFAQLADFLGHNISSGNIRGYHA